MRMKNGISFMDPLEKSVSGIAISIFSQLIVDSNMPYELDEMNFHTICIAHHITCL
ncbi:conserved hypothetical protein [Trichinella spiralis]|uniref:hypothetical protein n=1 Tax=Trichinella spiralis TaxID=6334 RepID=UPI0001EFD9B2|nr:conserved hypothetical protein [Trichinella spiralis]